MVIRKNVLFFSEIELGPALRAKCELLEKEKMNIFIYEETNGEFWSNKEIVNKYKHLKKDEIKKLENFVIYMYGIRVLIKNFLLILNLKKRNKIILEVSDLPLRYGKIKNWFNKIVYNILILLLTDGLILTSPYFKKYLPNKPIFIFENLPNDYIIEEFLKLNTVAYQEKKKINIGFVGGLRYFEQLELLIKFASNKKNINVHFYGQENLFKNKGLFKKEFLKNTPTNVYYHGKFNYEKEIKTIYENLDLIYCVYDSKQLNVQVALPNKLYESILSRRVILVSEKTALYEEVKKYRIGYSLPSSLEEYEKFEKKFNEILENLKFFENGCIGVSELLEKIKFEKENFKNFLIK